MNGQSDNFLNSKEEYWNYWSVCKRTEPIKFRERSAFSNVVMARLVSIVAPTDQAITFLENKSKMRWIDVNKVDTKKADT